MSHLLLTPVQLGQMIFSARKSQGMTQADLARLLGVSQSRVSQIEHSPGTLTVQQLLALMAVLRLQLRVETGDGVADSLSGSISSEW